MFVVCDRIISQRALDLREKIFKIGYPCAVAEIKKLADYMPVVQIITFTDVFDDVRRTPYDHIHVLAFGQTGFINSALNAERVESEELLFEKLDRVRNEFYHIQDHWIYPFGRYYDDGIYMGNVPHNFISVFNNIINFTTMEYRIFRYLQAVSRLCNYVPAERICQFCYAYNKIPQTPKSASNNIAVHVAKINRKFEETMEVTIIISKRFIGYRFAKFY